MNGGGMSRSERTVGQPLDAGRQAFLRYAVQQYGVSKAGAEEFVAMRAVSDPDDRKQLLDLVNRVIVDGSGTPSHRFMGKGPHLAR